MGTLLKWGLGFFAAVCMSQLNAQVGAPVVEPHQQDAMVLPSASRAMMLASVRTGNRIVAVGDHGVVLISEGTSAEFRQAKKVPTRATLNDVYFVDDMEGWAAGHWGVILHTTDRGETWEQQRRDTSVDQPLFAIHFFDARHGLAAGLWSLLLSTDDGGKTWKSLQIPAPEGTRKADKNLYDIISDNKGLIIIAAEQGWVYRSTDGGDSWTAVATGAKASYWTGLILDDGAVLVTGLTGKIARSTDSGKTWALVESGSRSSSIASLRQSPSGLITGVGLEGIQVVSHDRGLSFQATQREDRLPMTNLLPTSRLIASTPTGFVQLK